MKWTERWRSVVLNWINSLREVTTSFTRLSSASESDFIITLIKKIYESDKKRFPEFHSNEELVDKFTKEYFPENHSEKQLSFNNEEDCFIIYSFLMYACCIRCQIEDIILKNSSIMEGTTRGVLKKFFQEMSMIGDGNFTRIKILTAIVISLGLASSSPRCPQSPIPSLSCLREFIDSPPLQDGQSKINESRRLICQLKKEVNEKLDLLYDVLKEENKIDQNEELLNNLKQMEYEMEDLHVKLDKSDEENLELSNKIKAQELAIDNYQRQCEEYNVKLISVKKENYSLKCELEVIKRNELNVHISEPEKKIEYQDSEKTGLETEFASQVKIHQQTLSEKEELMNRCIRLEKVVLDLNSKSSSVETSLEEAQEVIMKQKAIINGLEDTLKTTQEQQATLSKQQEMNAFDPQLKEAHDKLYQDFHILTDEHESLTAKYNSLLEVHKNVRQVYEAKLNKLKGQMKERCDKAMRQTEGQCEKEVKELQHAIRANQEHINQLSSQLGDTRDKLITTKKENEELKKSLNELKNFSSHQNMGTLKQRTRSLGNVSFSPPLPPVRQNMGEPLPASRHQSED